MATMVNRQLQTPTRIYVSLLRIALIKIERNQKCYLNSNKINFQNYSLSTRVSKSDLPTNSMIVPSPVVAFEFDTLPRNVEDCV